MTKKEQYLQEQAASGIEVGDEVKVLRVAEDGEQGWHNVWINHSMDVYVGKVCKVLDRC